MHRELVTVLRKEGSMNTIYIYQVDENQLKDLDIDEAIYVKKGQILWKTIYDHTSESLICKKAVELGLVDAEVAKEFHEKYSKYKDINSNF